MTQLLVPLAILGVGILMLWKRPRKRDLPSPESKCNAEMILLIVEIQNINSNEEYEEMELHIDRFAHYWQDGVDGKMFNDCIRRIEKEMFYKKYFA